MFTGIILAKGSLERREHIAGDERLWVCIPEHHEFGVALGDSVALSGVCLTVASIEGDLLAFDVSNETLSLTTLGAMDSGAEINIEPALRAGDRLGGHMVSGHVDARAELISAVDDARSLRMTFRAPKHLARYLAKKGSVTLDGVSLTVNEVEGADFDVNLIPHTLSVTTLGNLRAGQAVNLEIDVLARYAERLFSSDEKLA